MPAATDVVENSSSVPKDDQWKKKVDNTLSAKSPFSSEVIEKSEKHHGKNIHINIQNGVYNHGFMEEQEIGTGTVHGRADSVPNTKFIKSGKGSERRRIVSKSGDCNTKLYRVNKKNRRFMQDVFTTMVDMQWRFVFFAFTASFILSWFGFGIIWWIIAYVHGDYLPENMNNSTFIPCILANKNFASAFLFSQETMHTIGYGSRQTTEECPEAIILQCVQSVWGVLIQACMAGIVFAKLARPKCRTNTIVFSKQAVICRRNGHLFLLFRVANMRSSHLLEAHARAQLVQKVSTEEGEVIHFHQEELKVGTQLSGEEDRALLLWPLIIAHRIDEESPLWRMSPQDIQSTNFEIIVTLEGIVEPTGNTTQARSSYLPQEILWGQRFQNVVSYAEKEGVYAIDCSNIDLTVPDDTPKMSACHFEKVLSRGKVTGEDHFDDGYGEKVKVMKQLANESCCRSPL